MSGSGSDSGGKKKPPNIKKKRGEKVPLHKFLREPTEEASLGPMEEATATAVNIATAAAANPAAAAATAANAAPAAAATKAAPAVAGTNTAPATAAVNAAAANAVNVSEAAAAVTAAATVTAVAATVVTAKTAATTTVAAPKLTEVVKTASANAPAPRPVTARPALSGQKKPGPGPGPSAAVNSSAGLVPGSSYAQQVSGGPKKSQFIEIQGKYVAPRQPPSASGKPRPKSDEGLQGLFAGRWQDERYGMCFEQIRGSSQGAYLEAICSVIPQDDIFSFGSIDRGMAELYTTNLESATKLMLEGIEVGGRHLTPFPVSVKPTRVVFSRVPMRAENEDLLSFLRMFGKVHGKVRAIPLKIGDKGLGRGIFSTSREAYVSVNQGCRLPEGFYLNISGSRSFIEVSTEAKCYACHQVGHFIADCPKRAGKAAEPTKKEVPATAETPTIVASPVAAPSLVVQPAKEMPHNPSEEAKHVAGNNPTSMREETSSSDEEQQPGKPGKKKRTKRRSKKAPLENMPPPSAPALPKRRRADEGSESNSAKKAVLSADNAELPSESEMLTLDADEELTEGGYESCGSTVSIGSHFEMAPTLEGVPREKVRSILDRLHYKKNSDTIWGILKQELGDPLRILPQLLVLQKEARKRRKYMEASRIDRLHKKIIEISEERILDDSLRP